MTEKEKLGDKIRLIRESKGISQEKLAELVGISTRNLQRIEYGQCDPKTSTLLNISKAFEITIDQLFLDTDTLSNISEQEIRIHSLLNKLKHKDSKDVRLFLNLMNTVVDSLTKDSKS